MNIKEKAIICVNELKKEYPDAVCSLEYTEPLELLIATRLAAQCTDARVNMVTPALFERFPDIDAFADSTPEEIEPYIHSCGFFRAKAKDINEMCKMLRDKYNYKIPDTVEELTKLPGVGRKTANLVVGDIYKKPAVVTDTHCIRICGRLGLYPESLKDPVKIEKILKELIEPEEGSDFCHRIVLFGRDVCTARSPACQGCPLCDLCIRGEYGK